MRIRPLTLCVAVPRLRIGVPENLRCLLLEELQPTQGDRLGYRLRRPKLVGRLAPVEPDPAGRVLARPVDKIAKLLGTAFEREDLLDHHGLADRREALQRLNGFLHLSLLGIQVDGKEVELISNLFGDKPGRQTGPIQAPWDKPHRHQVPLVMLADRRDERVNPLPSDLGTFSARPVERDVLDEVFVAKPRTEPVLAFLIPSSDHRLVH